MKEPEYNEIDRLLRNLAAREHSMPDDVAGAELSAPGAHLDADELSSYAEGALPVSTRARYTSHLADCDDCRRIVSQLSIAAGSVIKEDKGNQETAISRWRKVLATLFTPVVLRYAMPALALMVVGSFAFFAWRQQRETSFVALNKQADVPAATQPTGDTSKDGSPVAAPAPVGQQQKAAPPPSGSATTAEDKVTSGADEKKADEKKADEKKADDAPSSSAGAAAKEKDAPRNEAAPATQPKYAPEPAVTPPPEQPTISVAKAPAKGGENTIDKIETRDAAIGSRKDSDKARGSGAPTVNGTMASQSRPREKTKALAVGRAAADRRAGEAEQQTDEESESRTVNGRRFQRRNGAWIDTAYKSSATTINVARGSEQYRALIADEPGIDSIARQLSGEIVLVWKGHAYRIQ